jgi:UDP-N-acetylmuramate--alanine ligase
VEKDHKEVDFLMDVFTTFNTNSRHFVVNQSHPLSQKLSRDISKDFSFDPLSGAGYIAENFSQDGMHTSFTINNTWFYLNTAGKHNMENALAATAVAAQIGVDLESASAALAEYEGIYRRHQVLGVKKGIWVIDDYAHNPVKCAAAIAACQPIADKVIAWFQPHGYSPTKFLRDDFVAEISNILRPADEIWMSEIFYAGGTASKDISSNDLINDIKQAGRAAFFVENRNDLLEAVRPHLKENTVLLLMGARDPSLEQFAKQVWENL